MAGFIQDLLARKEHLNAIRFASMFDLLSEFPPDPIMKEFMEMSRSAFKSIYDNENSSLEAQVHVVTFCPAINLILVLHLIGIAAIS